MSTILSFRRDGAARARRPAGPAAACEIVIFPGVRIERHEVDLAYRVSDVAATGDFDGFGGNDRPRKTS
jgi:hypothetical protein